MSVALVVGVLIGFVIAACALFGFVVLIALMGSSQESKREEQQHVAVPVNQSGRAMG